jgi:flagellar hook-basal body complex protein FliE
VKSEEEDRPVPLQQDIRMIDYLQEFAGFISKQQLSAKQKAFALTRGKEVLQSVMDEHREMAE